MDDEYVETSDIEELEELNDSLWIPRTRSLSPDQGRAQLPPSKKIKLFHDNDSSALALPSTPVRAVPGEYVPETPALKPFFQTPTPSHSSATIGINHATSPTQVSESPGANPAASKAEVDDENGQLTGLSYDSQDPLLLHSSQQQPVLSASLLMLPSPSQFLTTPPSTPTTNRRSARKSPCSRYVPSVGGDPSSPSPSVVSQSPASLHVVDRDGDVLMDDRCLGIDSLFSSPVKGPSEATISSPYTRSRSPLHSLRASSPLSLLGGESPSPLSPEPPRSHSEPSSVPAELEDEDDEMSASAREHTPEIPPEQPYVFRERKPKQILPYTADKLEYKALTRGHREARVHIRSPSRGHGRQPDENGDEESQDPAFISNDESEKSDGEGRRNKPRRIVVDDPLEEIQNTEDEMERRRRKREGKRAEKTQMEEEKELRQREQAQRKKEREQKAVVRSRTTVAGPSKNHSAAGPSNRLSGHLNSKSSTNRQEDIFDRYQRELEADDDEGDLSPRASPRVPQDEAISISSDSDDGVPSRTQSLLRTQRHSSGLSRKGSTAPSRSASPASSSHSDSGIESSHPPTAKIAAEDPDVAPLFLIYPRSLAMQLLADGRLKSKRSKPRRAESVNPEENGPLQPGQTRVRKRKGAEPRVIKGDSESELDMPDQGRRSRSPSPSTSSRHLGSSRSPVRSQPRRQHAAPRKHRVKVEYESDLGSEVESIDDNAIDLLTTGAKTAVRPKGEVTLIDYMLSGTRTLKSYSDVKKRKENRSKPKLDIVTAGVRGNPQKTQALLSNFKGYGRNHQTGAGHANRSSASRGSETPTRRNDDGTIYPSSEDDEGSGSENENRQYQAGGTSHKATNRQKGEKGQKPKRVLYILKPAGGGKARIVSGARKELSSVEVEADAGVDAHSGPKIRPWHGPDAYRRVRPPARRPRLDTQKPPPERQSSLTPEPLWVPERDASPSVEVEQEQTEAEKIPIIKDSNIPRLLSGIAFAPDTYTKKGWLFELISLSSPSPDSTPPAPVSLGSDFDIPTDATPDDVASIVGRALDRLFDFTNDPPSAIPDPDAEQQTLLDNWATTSQNVCRGVSFFLSKLPEGNRSEVVEHLRASIRLLVGRLESWRMPRCRLDARTFLANWTAVELSVRIGEPLTRNARLTPSVLTESIQLLVNQLIFFGLDSTMKPVFRGLEAESLSKSSLPGYTAEMWVRLIHLCCEYDKREAKMHNPTFWQFILASFKESLRGITPDVGYHEDLWHSVFSLCALSQFNVHGMVRELVNLQACWDLVHFLCDEALQYTEGEPEVHHSYVRYLLSRFFILNERWGWRVVNVASLVKLVVEKVFHPIKFGNLKGEKPDFPKFLCEPNGDDLSTWDETDRAYVLLLKFVFKAAKEPGIKESVIKKLVSLSEPAIPIHFDNEHPLRCKDMDRVINRITAAIVAVHLVGSKEYLSSKVTQIRDALPFAAANMQTRHTLIRGLQYWTHSIIQRQPNLGTHLLTPWLGDMADTFATEWKCTKPSQEDRHLQLSVKMVLQVVHKVYESSPGDPEGDFLAELKPLLRVTIRVTREDEAIQQYARNILATSIDRWYREHPPMRPPEPKDEVQEESQDFYGNAFGDIDWDGADIPQELGGPAGSQEQQAKDAGRPTFKETIDDQLQWFLFRSFKDCFEDGDIEHGLTFISTWVGCKLLLLKSGTVEQEIEAMSDILANQLGKSMAPHVRQTVDMAFALALLRRHPMVYTMPHLADRFKFEYFLIALTNGNESFLPLAADYVSELLSVDHFQHPLLHGCQPLLPPSGSIPVYAFGVEEFVEIRKGILETIISNLDTLVGQGHPSVAQYIESLAESFSAMRQALIGAFSSLESKAECVALCSDVLKLVRESPNLAECPRMSFWVNSWTPRDKQARAQNI